MIGDGVAYHGSAEDFHGLYVVVGGYPGSWILASVDNTDVLYNVRDRSFETLLPRSLVGGEREKGPSDATDTQG